MPRIGHIQQTAQFDLFGIVRLDLLRHVMEHVAADVLVDYFNLNYFLKLFKYNLTLQVFNRIRSVRNEEFNFLMLLRILVEE